jgi:thiosulfate dehydrogenase [quinone] large subunit
MRIAAVSGVILLVMMWSAVLPPENHIFMDDHIIYALVIVGLALVGAGRTWGFGNWWSRTALVQRYPWLT